MARGYTWSQKLEALATNERQLDEFGKIFIPKYTEFAITKPHGGVSCWKAGRGRIHLDEVARHLPGDRLPGLLPVALGVRAWAFTRYAVIDVDNHRGDPDEFARDCAEAEACLSRLGVAPRDVLMVATPSGGRHLWVFFAATFPTSQLPELFRLAGLRLEKGRIEVYPREDHAILSASSAERMPSGGPWSRSQALKMCR